MVQESLGKFSNECFIGRHKDSNLGRKSNGHTRRIWSSEVSLDKLQADLKIMVRRQRRVRGRESIKDSRAWGTYHFFFFPRCYKLNRRTCQGEMRTRGGIESCIGIDLGHGPYDLFRLGRMDGCHKGNNTICRNGQQRDLCLYELGCRGGGRDRAYCRNHRLGHIRQKIRHEGERREGVCMWIQIINEI